jgi:ABC-type transport system involved in cytochrome bd biosynthesis fused ATPase/permease subunit
MVRTLFDQALRLFEAAEGPASFWQLSQGERSRLFIAHTLLHGADCLLLDESFAALDPETSQQAMQCVLERAPTLLVIAHP